jgi:hypothetical protein
VIEFVVTVRGPLLKPNRDPRSYAWNRERAPEVAGGWDGAQNVPIDVRSVTVRRSATSEGER